MSWTRVHHAAELPCAGMPQTEPSTICPTAESVMQAHLCNLGEVVPGRQRRVAAALAADLRRRLLQAPANM